MKKVSLSFLSLISLAAVFLIPTAVSANFQSDMNTQTGAFAGSQGAGYGPAQDPRIVVAQMIKLGLTLVGTLFLVYTVYAGFLILTSAGDEEKINKAKSTIRTGTIGILITLSSYAIVTFVTGSLLSTSSSQTGASITTQARDMRNQSTDPYASDGSPFIPQELNQSTH